MYYQPKVRLRDGQVASAEALVRWQHPQKGFIYPSDFIPVFERSGDICRLALYVFEEVCAMLAGRLAQGAPVFPVAVNLSGISRQRIFCSGLRISGTSTRSPAA